VYKKAEDRYMSGKVGSYCGVHERGGCAASPAGKTLPRLRFVAFSGDFPRLPTSLEHVHDSHACENAKPLLI
jgi:hypothetical protein